MSASKTVIINTSWGQFMEHICICNSDKLQEREGEEVIEAETLLYN